MRNTQLRIRRGASGAGTPEDFELVESESPSIRGGQLLVRARWLALEPALDAVPSSGGQAPGAPLPARAVGEVLEARHDVFDVGDCVVLEMGMQSLCVSDGVGVYRLHPGQSPASSALGVLGTPGLLAWCGLLAAELRAGETMLVTARTRAAGALAGQIAQMRGARAIGLAASREECDWAVRHARFAACIEESAQSVDRLRALAPRGFDVLFVHPDEPSFGALTQAGLLARSARVLACGDSAHGSSGLARLEAALSANARLQVLRARDCEPRREAFLKEAMPWLEAGLIVHRERVLDGLAQAPDALARLARTPSFAQTLVRMDGTTGQTSALGRGLTR